MTVCCGLVTSRHTWCCVAETWKQSSTASLTASLLTVKELSVSLTQHGSGSYLSVWLGCISPAPLPSSCRRTARSPPAAAGQPAAGWGATWPAGCWAPRSPGDSGRPPGSCPRTPCTPPAAPSPSSPSPDTSCRSCVRTAESRARTESSDTSDRRSPHARNL